MRDWSQRGGVISQRGLSPCLRAALILCLVAASPAQVPLRPGSIGDAGCAGCHAAESTSYLHTAHHLTSQLPASGTVLGSFVEGENVLTIIPVGNPQGQPALYFTMKQQNGRYTQTAATGFPPNLLQRTAPIDIVTGSGKRGQTYLYWDSDKLLELPVSFWSAGRQWVNSPGFENGTIDFNRPIQPGCLECHATSIQPIDSSSTTNRYVRSSFNPGISCEVCHGAGAAHAALHAAGKANVRLADEQIVNPAKLSRNLQVDLCALCHNGVQRRALEPPFSYKPGETLARFYQPLPSSSAEHPDVHGQQVGLLERSRCFQSSSMSCSTCHNTHEAEHDAASYSSRCLTCHSPGSCKVAGHLSSQIRSDCISCHMPVEPTRTIVSQTAGRKLHTSMRNHWIKVYLPSSAMR